jgi:hypothetical protein
VSVIRYLIFLLLCGCATEQLKIERMLAAAQFDQRKINTPERKATVAEMPPYTFLKMTEKNKGVRYAFISPARRTVFFGDEAAMQRYVAYLTAQEQSNQMRRLQGQQRAANFQQALAYGLAANAMQQPVYYQQPYQPPPPMQIPNFQAPQIVTPSPASSTFNSFTPAQTTTFRRDALAPGGAWPTSYRGSDGTTIQRQRDGSYTVTEPPRFR